MSRLRLVRPRTVASENIGDLRGVDDSGSLSNEYPWIYLAIQGDVRGIERAIDLFALKKKTLKSGETILFRRGRGHDHKFKAVTLFGAALMVLKANPNAKMLLGQHNRLADLYDESAMSNPDPELKSEDYVKWTQSEPGLQLGEIIPVYLEHAGFNVQGHFVRSTEVDEHLKENKAPDQQTRKTSQHKAG